jgi:hypothetical protein
MIVLLETSFKASTFARKFSRGFLRVQKINKTADFVVNNNFKVGK